MLSVCLDIYGMIGIGRKGRNISLITLGEISQSKQPRKFCGKIWSCKWGIGMIITQTPFRMSFFGGGTDMPDFFKEHGGAVLSSTFDKYCYVTVRHLPRFFDWKTHLTYSKTEYVNSYDEIRHPAIRNAMRMLDMHELRITYDADLPARSGLGTSSSFAVGMLGAFHALKGKYVSKQELADEAIHLERNLCGEMGGWQDQIAASYGGFNRIDFNQEGYQVRPLIISPQRKQALNDRLMMFFTGFTSLSAKVQAVNVRSKSHARTERLQRMRCLVDEAECILTDGHNDLDDFGRLLDYTWQLKRQTGRAVSTDEIDRIYMAGREAGALGGKILGAGGGGFMLFYVQPERQAAVHVAMRDLLYIPFRFENDGMRIAYYMPENYVPSEEDL